MSELRDLFDQRISDVIQDISPNDEMYLGNKEHYVHVGQSAIQCIKLAILASGRDFSDIKEILDLPCGYGRVSRMLKVEFPDAQLTGCDLLRDGVEYCKQLFGVKPLYSDKDIKNVKTDEKFDLIWCGSLLTHLNSDRWPAFIDFFNDALDPKGILVFTTHGRYVADLMRSKKCNYGIDDIAKLMKIVQDFDALGFGYANYPHSDEYGISASSPSYVLSLIEKQFGLRILTYLEKGWDDHQDVIACIKE
jgi:SAM-dependent methyltransferase